MIKSLVNYEVLKKFTDEDTLDLEYHKVTNDIENTDIERGINIIFKYYRKSGFPHYIINDPEKYSHFEKLRKFNSNTIFENNQIIQTMHCLRLVWSYFPHWIDVRCGTSLSPREAFNDDVMLKTIIKKCWNWQLKYGNNKFTLNRFRQSLKLYGGSYGVSNFRPTAAKLIYEKYGGDGVVWDMSCGWGGRLLGFFAASNTKHYIGTEPSTRTYEGLMKMKKDFTYLNKKVDIYKKGSEEFLPQKESLNLCFTSPPYFDTEKYSLEKTQSFIKFPTEDEWINGFLKKTIENCYSGLKYNCYMLLNIAKTNKYKWIEKATISKAKEVGFNFVDTLELILSSIAGRGYKYEPVFVFKKELL